MRQYSIFLRLINPKIGKAKNMNTITLVDTNPNTIQLVTRYAQETGCNLSVVEECRNICTKSDLVLINSRLAVSYSRPSDEGGMVVLLCEDLNPEILGLSLSLPADDLIMLPFEPRKIDALMNRLRQSRLTKESGPSGPCQTSKLIGFISSQSSTGQSFLATHVAEDLALSTHKKLLLVEMEDAPERLLVSDRHSRQIGLIRTGGNGIETMTLPRLSPALLDEILSDLKLYYPYIVMDCSKTLDPSGLALYEKMDVLFFVTLLDKVAIQQTAVNLELIRNMGFASHVKLIANMLTQGCVSKKEAEEFLHTKLSVMIPQSSGPPLLAEPILNQKIHLISELCL